MLPMIAAVPHRDQADLPAHGLYRDVHVPPGAQGLLFKRLASASIADRSRADAICSCRSARASIFRRSAAAFSAALQQYAAPARCSRRRPSTAIAASDRTRSRPTASAWGYDHRGAMLRVLGAPGDPATRLENRAGEPAANPYLFMASQIAAGLDGIEHASIPAARRRALRCRAAAAAEEPAAALDALEREPLFRTAFGDVFIDYFLKLKRNEAGRFERWLGRTGARIPTRPPPGSRTSISIFSDVG